ncbi:MAG: nuclear transport factor 2 family protein [Candidatus Sulfotelmatobacter sp.]
MAKLFCVLLLLLTVPRAFTQGAAPTPADESRILTLELAWNHAVQEKDVKALQMLIAPEMVYIEYDGTLMNQVEYLASVTSRSVNAEQILCESMTAHVYGPVALVSGVYRETGVRNGKPYLHRERFTDTWVLKAGNWLCVSSQSTLIAR